MRLFLHNRKSTLSKEREDMIDQHILSKLKQWFAEYAAIFKGGDVDRQLNINLKEEHSLRVCSEIIDVGKSLGLSRDELSLAEAMALFHDVGRFEQYAKYGTFHDRVSEDHAALGVKVLEKQNALDGVDPSTRGLILRVILYHNRAVLPEYESEKCLFFARLLRDADKLDIWRILTDYYLNKDGPRMRSVELDLPDTPEFSGEVCRELLTGGIARAASIRTLNDFKLFQMGWVYDVNFLRTFQLVRERGYIETILAALPKTEVVMHIYSKVKMHLEKNC
jgi:hypothetical protein